MPILSRWMIRLALCYCLMGMTLASLLLAQKGIPSLLPAYVGGWVLVHVNLLLVGWMVQLAMGVAYWIMPRLPHTLTERGRYSFMLSAVICLNVGVWFYSLGIMSATWQPEWEVLQAWGMGLEVLAVLAFGWHLLPRIRAAVVN